MSAAGDEVVFFGSGAFGLPTLEHLASRHKLLGIVTQPDKPAGRGGAMTPTPVGQWATEHAPSVPLLKPAKVNVPDVVETIRGWGARETAWVVIAFGQKLGKALLADRWAINLHASILPRWRGAAPIHAAVLAGDPEIGNSIITLAETMDAGLILAQSRHAMDPAKTTGDWHELLAREGPGLVERVLEQRRRETLEARTQDETKVTLAVKLKKEDGWIDLSHGAEACVRRIHGLNPWPGVTVRLGEIDMKLHRADAGGAWAEQKGSGGEGLGTFVSMERGEVRCGGGTMLRLREVQPAGKRAMAWGDFVRGARLGMDARLVGREGHHG